MTRRQLIKLQSSKQNLSLRLVLLFSEAPNGWRYPLVGGTRQPHFDGTSFKPRKPPENAQPPTSRVHAVLGGRTGATPSLEQPTDSEGILAMSSTTVEQ